MIDVLRRPVWAIGTVICVVLVLLFVRLGLWQLERHDERQARNARVEERLDRDPVPVEQASTEYERVVVEGTWDDDGTVFIRNRSFRGSPGFHVVTPVVLPGGDAVLVNRGWAPDAEAPPATGRAEVEGIVRESQVRGSIGPRDPEDGVLRELARVDVGRIARQYDQPLLPFYVERQEAGVEEAPFPVEPPALGDGPHLGYAGQWFVFAAIGAVGWVILLRRQRDQPATSDVASIP